MDENLLLKVTDLNIEFNDHLIPETVVFDFDLELRSKEIVGLVGESGSGKSMSALAIAGLLSRKDMKKRGEILFEGKDLLTCGRDELRTVQGNDISMIFQEPLTCLNPVLRIYNQVEEPLCIHTKLTAEESDIEEMEVDDAEMLCDEENAETSAVMSNTKAKGKKFAIAAGVGIGVVLIGVGLFVNKRSAKLAYYVAKSII